MASNKDYGKVLGELETQVMKIIWQAQEPFSVSAVLKVLSKKRKVAYTTVMTIMGRLTEKGLLKRSQEGKAYFYKPAYSKDTFLTSVSRQIIRNLVSNFGDAAVAHFAEALEDMPSDKKQKLLKILKEAKNNERK